MLLVVLRVLRWFGWLRLMFCAMLGWSFIFIVSIVLICLVRCGIALARSRSALRLISGLWWWVGFCWFVGLVSFVSLILFSVR